MQLLFCCTSNYVLSHITTDNNYIYCITAAQRNEYHLLVRGLKQQQHTGVRSSKTVEVTQPIQMTCQDNGPDEVVDGLKAEEFFSR